MSVLDVKDRIPTNVLSNDAVRYGVYDEEGKLLRHEYMKREDEPIEEGTPINKVLLDNFQGDLYTQDRYNLLRATSKETKKVDINGFVQKSSIGNNIKAVATNGEGLYVAVGAKGYIATSTDLINWTQQTSGTTAAFYDIAYGDGVFIAVGQNQCVYKSADGGVTWASKLNAGSSYTLYSVAYGNGGFIASGNAQNVMSENNSFYSIDGGETWVARDVGQKNYTAYTHFVNNQFIITSAYNGLTIYTSPTADSSLAVKATNVTALGGYFANDIIYANDYYVAGCDGAFAISKDLVTWTQISTDSVNALLENEGQIIMGLDSDYLKATEDFEYIQQSTSTYGAIIELLEEGDKIISFSSTGGVFESTTYLSEHKQYLDMPLTSYEKGKIINVEGGRLFEPKDLETVTENLFPASSDFTSNSAREYTSSEGFILTSSGGQNLMNSIDGNSSTEWTDTTSTLTKQWIKMELPSSNSYKITKMKLQAGWTNSSSKEIAIEGSFDGSNWINLFVASGTGITVEENNILLDNPDFYKYYRVSVSFNTGAVQGQARVYEWAVSEYLKVLSVDEQYVTSFYNPMLNINNLGEKQINATINYGQKYSLVYNGESWDVVNAKVVTGSVSIASDSTISIPLYGAKCIIADRSGGTPQYSTGARLVLPNGVAEYLYLGNTTDKYLTATLSEGGYNLVLECTTGAGIVNYVVLY